MWLPPNGPSPNFSTCRAARSLISKPWSVPPEGPTLDTMVSPRHPDQAFSARPQARTETADDERASSASDQSDVYKAFVQTAALDPRLLQGPFASHVWAGRYEILGLQARGAQGVTFRGLDRKTGARVAVKFFDLGRATDWKALELFDREVSTLQRLSHAGVPRFVDVVKDDDTGARALVMTYLEGESLTDVIAREGALPEKRLWPLLFEVSKVLASVHTEGVVHRDLKPANLILRADGGVGVVDFGGVGHFRNQAGSTVVGTFGYMAPEQLYGAQTPATDLYALGATLLHAATGRAPEDQPRQGLAIDVDAAAPFLSPALRTLLTRLLSPEPQGRPRDAAALVQELTGAERAAPSKNPASGGRPQATPAAVVDAVWQEDRSEGRTTRTRSWPVAWVLVALLALVVVIGRVLLPMVFTLFALLAAGPAQKRLRAVVDRVDGQSRLAQKRLEGLLASPRPPHRSARTTAPATAPRRLPRKTP
jgi:hypothetical protein